MRLLVTNEPPVIAPEAVNAETPLGAAALAEYIQFVEEEDGRGRDFSAMLPRFETKPRT